MKYIQLLLVLVAMILFAGQRTDACDCAGGSMVCQDYWLTTAVFAGTVVDSKTVTIEEGKYPRRMRAVRLSLDEIFRGVEGGEVEVLTGFGGGDCGFGFQQARQYLVYAYKSESDGKLYTSICTRTKAISEADKDLAYIRGLSKAKHGATISGEVVKYLRDKQGTLANQYLSGVRVSIEGDQNTEVVTDAKGQYRVEDLRAGEYTVRVTPPDRLTARELQRKIKVSDRGCAAVSFWLESNAQLGGRVLNPQGLPVARAEISMNEAGKERYRGHWDTAYADEEGRYNFKLIPPGRYVLMIRFDGMTSQNRPFPAIYYPGVSDVSQAKVFTIEEGEAVGNYDLAMPPLPAEYEIQGTVVWSNGKPAADARVEYDVDAVAYGIEVDDKAQFRFKAYEGLYLAMRATIKGEKGGYLYSNWVYVTAGPTLQPVKIVLTGP